MDSYLPSQWHLNDVVFTRFRLRNSFIFIQTTDGNLLFKLLHFIRRENGRAFCQDNINTEDQQSGWSGWLVDTRHLPAELVLVLTGRTTTNIHKTIPNYPRSSLRFRMVLINRFNKQCPASNSILSSWISWFSSLSPNFFLFFLAKTTDWFNNKAFIIYFKLKSMENFSRTKNNSMIMCSIAITTANIRINWSSYIGIGALAVLNGSFIELEMCSRCIAKVLKWKWIIALDDTVWTLTGAHSVKRCRSPN